MKIYLIRHGQTTGDVEDRYGGNYDDHLSEEGEVQALKLAARLKDSGIQVILTSPLARAKETAEIFKATLGCDVTVLENVRERNQYGVLTGLVKSEAKLQYPDLVEKVKDYHNTIERAEPYSNFKQRIEKVFGEFTNVPYSTIAVVTHGGPIRTIFREILKAGEIDVADCAYALLEKTDSDVKIVELNGIDYRTD